MGIFTKIKGMFIKEVETGHLEPITFSNTNKPTGKYCYICAGEILENEATRDFKGEPAHKRCTKKVKKLVLQGLSLESIQETLRGKQ